MWQAYYAKEKFRLFRLLVDMLREQYHYSWQKAVRAAYLPRTRRHHVRRRQRRYDRVLPDLEAGYTIARDWTGASFDPHGGRARRAVVVDGAPRSGVGHRRAARTASSPRA